MPPLVPHDIAAWYHMTMLIPHNIATSQVSQPHDIATWHSLYHIILTGAKKMGISQGTKSVAKPQVIKVFRHLIPTALMYNM